MKLSAVFFVFALLLSACATAPSKIYEFADVTFSTDFESGNLKTVTKNDIGYTLAVAPENTPINDSPWYAFEITAQPGAKIPITLAYEDGTHRYSPKIQLPNGAWTELESDIDIAEDESVAAFTIMPTSEITRIAAQPIMDTQDHMMWAKTMSALGFVSFETIGLSVEKRPIYKLEEIDNPDIKKPYIVIIGRQHPPEITGAQALKPFVETIWGDSDLAQRFRDEYNLIVVPLINPDGVARGHWRHNMRGVDLNRDWGPFTQPETQAVEEEFQRFKTGEDDIVLFLDFHSTWRNLIYTQTDQEPTNPAFFTRDWIANVKTVLPEEVYSFTREANVTTERPVSKNYMYHTYGIPAMTFEVGDETPLENTETASRIFAEEMMRLLLGVTP